MQPTANAEPNRASELKPEVSHAVSWRLVSATVLGHARLAVAFVDGTTGEVDMGKFLSSRRIAGTAFEPLRDPEFFSQARGVLGAVQWPNGADLAPDAMYDAIRENAIWVLD